ncbi:MAG TPA: serine hydrolase domain-containing protein [Stellaceae bacterium]|nr:serine hydrolase domain-containing protein [Stellaceae bacterium]
MSFVLPTTDLAAAGLRPEPIARMEKLIEQHIAEGRYPGAQVAIARRGKLAYSRNYGLARIAPAVPARDETLWRLYSNTKVITAAAIWVLVEDGLLSFSDRVAEHLPDFARNGKGAITIFQVLTHQAGFPNAPVMPPESWEDHQLLKRLVCDYTLEWTPGSRLHYHSYSAHWVLALIIEALTKMDFRAFIRSRVIEPLGLGAEMFVGMGNEDQTRCAEMYEPAADGKTQKLIEAENTVAFRRAGVPSGGGFATARAMAAFYQALLAGGALGERRILSPRMVQYVTRNFTGERPDEAMGGIPMHRGLGPHSRGTSEVTRGLGSLAHPNVFGHGGVGSSYCWADPESGMSFAYISNSKYPDPWHSRRLELISNCVHAAIV